MFQKQSVKLVYKGRSTINSTIERVLSTPGGARSKLLPRGLNCLAGCCSMAFPKTLPCPERPGALRASQELLLHPATAFRGAERRTLRHRKTQEETLFILFACLFITAVLYSLFFATIFCIFRVLRIHLSSVFCLFCVRENSSRPRKGDRRKGGAGQNKLHHARASSAVAIVLFYHRPWTVIHSINSVRLTMHGQFPLLRTVFAMYVSCLAVSQFCDRKRLSLSRTKHRRGHF